MKTYCSLMFCFLAMSGCRTTEPGIDGSNVKVIGGVEVVESDAMRRVTVALRAAGGTNPIFCTGTLIARHAILTAGHCDVKPGDLISFTSLNAPDVRLRATKTFTHPCFATEAKSEWDLSVVHFDAPLPAGFGPPVPLADPNSVEKGAKLVAVGFGRYSNASDDIDGKLRRVQMEVVTSQADSPYLLGGFGVVDGQPVSICNGDSGGPHFDVTNDMLRLAGVSVGGASRQGWGCLDISLIGEVPKRADWINSAIEGAPESVDVATCKRLFDITKLPPTLNDERRGPPECRLSADEDVAKVITEITWAYPDNFADGNFHLVGQRQEFSAPIAAGNVVVQAVGSAETIELQPIATGKGRNCFVHEPETTVGIKKEFKYSTTLDQTVMGTYKLGKNKMSLTSP